MDDPTRMRAIEWLGTLPGVTAVDRVDGDDCLTAVVRPDQYELAHRLLERHSFEVLGVAIRLRRDTPQP